MRVNRNERKEKEKGDTHLGNEDTRSSSFFGFKLENSFEKIIKESVVLILRDVGSTHQ